MADPRQINTLPYWANTLVIYEAERIYEMMPHMFGARAAVVQRLEAGIIDLLRNEIAKLAA